MKRLAANVLMLKEAMDACQPTQIEAILRDRLDRGDWTPAQIEAMSNRIRQDAWHKERAQ